MEEENRVELAKEIQSPVSSQNKFNKLHRIPSFPGISYQVGKLNISQTFHEWSCNSACSPPQGCRLPRCSKVQFPQIFSRQENVCCFVLFMKCLFALFFFGVIWLIPTENRKKLLVFPKLVICFDS